MSEKCAMFSSASKKVGFEAKSLVKVVMRIYLQHIFISAWSKKYYSSSGRRIAWFVHTENLGEGRVEQV